MKRIHGIAALALAAGCGGGSQLSMSTRVGTPVAQATQAGTSPQALTVSTGIDVSRIRIVIREMELDRSESADAGTPEAHEEFEAGPFLLDLSAAALQGGVNQAVQASVPSGTYSEVEFKIAQVHDNDHASSLADPALQAMKSQSASIIVDGTISGASFSFVSGLEAKQEYKGRFVIVSGSDNVTLNVDPTSWFVSATGGTLDPRDVTVKSQIESNIRASLRLFKDHDRRGRADP